ncbi:MAG: hypothetical protein AB8B79_14135 [Granulosicoccus sp.]
MNTVVQKRLDRAAAARVLLALHAAGNLDNPARWTWESVDRLPAWCLAGAEERIKLQLTCGAMYLSPDIRFWINKSALLAVQQLLGTELFEHILAKADEMLLPRESVSDVIAQTGLDPVTAQMEQIQAVLMAAGATVLTATVHKSLPYEMLTESLGPGIGDITEQAATTLLKAAELLILDTGLSEANVS